MPCKCNTAKRDPDCTIQHPLNELLVDMAFPNLDREPLANPNPMNARCGLEACDCEYTIGGLLRRLEIIVEQANLTIDQTRSPLARRRSAYHPSACPCGYTQTMECGTSCLCYVAGSEAERRPIGQ